MLDLSKLLPQFESLHADGLRETTEAAIERASELLAEAAANSERYQDRLLDARDLTFWPLSTPLEPLNAVWQLSPRTDPHTVVATDGSQILPSQHEVYSCYLINVGKVVITYGADHPVILDTTPHLYHSVDDLYPVVDRRRMYVDDTFVGLERGLLELSSLRDLSLQMVERGLPVVALVDGSLIQWSLHQMPDSYQRAFTKRVTAIYDSFSSHNIPLIGYISHSRSTDVINTLRVWQCPYTQVDCSRHCSELCEEDYPCSTIWPVTDRQLYTNTMPRNFRSPFFVSGAGKAAALPERHRVVFTYLNVGDEVARIEMPAWLLKNKELAQSALQTALSQAEKGRGYPVALAEAHNLAVIRGGDRRQFFELVANHLVQLGIPRVRVSPKETGKRRGVV